MKNVLAIAAVVAAAGAVANGQVYMESGDATDMTPGQSVSTFTTQIQGLTSDVSDADVYGFSWSGGVLTIDTFGTAYDTQLHLFDIAGNGIGENDDSVNGAGLDSQISLDLPAGSYMIGITGFNQDALDGSGLDVFGFTNTFSDLAGNFIQGPEGNGPLGGWDSNNSNYSGDYVINFSARVSAVPAPGAMALLGLGGIAAIRRRR